MKLLHLGAALIVATALGACHSSDHDQQPPPVAGTPTPTPTATDGFFDYVSKMVASLTETAEPENLDAVVASSPETTEPQPLPGS